MVKLINTNEQKKSISQLAIILIIARGISILITIFIPLVLVRMLSQEAFGTYKQSLLLVSTAITLIPWGMAQSLYYFLPKDLEHRSEYLLNTIRFLLITGCCAFILFSLSGPFLINIFHNAEMAKYAPMLGIYVFFMIVTSYSEIVLTAENRVSAAAWIILFYELGKAIILILGAWVTRSYQGIIICLAISAIIRFILITFYFRRDLINIFQPCNYQLLHNQWHYAMPFGMMSLFSFFQDTFHQYYISFYFTAAQFAIYAVGCLDLPVIDLFYSSIGNIVMVKMTESLRENNVIQAKEMWHEAITKLALVFFPLTIFMALIGHHFIIALFTKRYEASVPIFIISLITIPSTILLVDPVLRVFDENRYMLWISIFRLPLTFFMVTLALQIMGIIGGAVSTVLIMYIVRCTMLMRVKKVMKLTMAQLLPWRALINICFTAICAGIPVMILTCLDIPDKTILILSTAIYGLSYLIVGVKTAIFTIEERELFKQLFTRQSLFFLNKR